MATPPSQTSTLNAMSVFEFFQLLFDYVVLMCLINVRRIAKYDVMPTAGMVDSSPTGINDNNGPIVCNNCSKPNGSTKAIFR